MTSRLVAAGLLALAAVAGRAESQRWTPRLQLDNDVYNFWVRHTRRPDEQYTNGVRATLASTGAAWWGRLARGTPDCTDARGPDPCRSTEVTLGQDLYTPNLDREPFEVEDWTLERPFFAWLYLMGTARVTSARSSQRVSVALGVTGPPAGGRLAQDIAHRIGFNEKVTGWETQIAFEPGVMVEYGHAIRLLRLGADRGPALDLAPELLIAAGNIRTRLQGGATTRIGWNLSHPWHPGSWRGRSRTEWWVSAGAHAESVARDMSLDGTWRNPSRRVGHVNGVRQYTVGAAFRYDFVTIAYQATTRSREYRTGPGHHTWSSMIVSLGPPD